MARYFEADKGHFDCYLVREDYPRPVAVAYTYGGTVRLTDGYCTADKQAVEEFADCRDLEVIWKD